MRTCLFLTSQSAKPNIPRKPIETVDTVIFIQMSDDFGVGPGGANCGRLKELLAEFLKVVDLSVEDDPDRAVFITDRLMSASYIDDAEPAHADANVFRE